MILKLKFYLYQFLTFNMAQLVFFQDRINNNNRAASWGKCKQHYIRTYIFDVNFGAFVICEIVYAYLSRTHGLTHVFIIYYFYLLLSEILLCQCISYLSFLFCCIRVVHLLDKFIRFCVAFIRLHKYL
jgi:hypothetical protein